jgi:hypothetical protein
MAIIGWLSCQFRDWQQRKQVIQSLETQGCTVFLANEIDDVDERRLCIEIYCHARFSTPLQFRALNLVTGSQNREPLVVVLHEYLLRSDSDAIADLILRLPGSTRVVTYRNHHWQRYDEPLRFLKRVGEKVAVSRIDIG